MRKYNGCLPWFLKKDNKVSYQITQGNGPIVSASIHAGHRLRREVADETALDEATRLREEDPHTDRLTDVAPTRIVVETSRFEVDLNRPRERAVYLTPQDAWGLELWKRPLPAEVFGQSLDEYDQFYHDVGCILDQVHAEWGNFAVLDLHSYCHRRGGPDSPPDDPQLNPEIIVGTSNIDTPKWSRLLERFIGDLREFDFDGRHLDVRKNVKFTGGHFSRWINRRYQGDACAIAVEFKKIFMDEWSGELDENSFELLKTGLASAIPGLKRELGHA